MADMIRLEKINKVYGEKIKTQVLFDIDLSFEKGSFNSIIGASGSGKSTLLNIIGTLDQPTSGKVFIGGNETSALGKKDLAVLRNKTLGFIFQFHYLLPEFTSFENVLMPHRIKGGPITKEIEDRANEIMDMVGLSAVKTNMANNMSGGQQQRTAIARALMNKPDIILADEPTGNLDSESTETVYKILRDINEKLETTFVIITHDRRIAEKADRIVEVKDGRIEMDIKR
ncbi:ABC transporter ATP-binding protein [Alkalibacter mobilis]|uniref:ABC transporter ATP-binding protein n=1 Tax=Alkalibacter mobilis TaxID=2787712 RepID=UPI00189DBA8A|nr:ABC transporter ATP-binding protein [Alkalibacter mobilis]MBF7096715.1 ABC transporter ATP-binding protein [Alkalibacter mobilis]